MVSIFKSNFVNLSDVFDTETEQVFSAFCPKSLDASQNCKASMCQQIQYCIF